MTQNYNIETRIPTILIPCKNEAANLLNLLPQLEALQQARVINGFVVVDDGSTDNTAEIARRYTPHVLRLPENQGKAHAWREGLRYMSACDINTQRPLIDFNSEAETVVMIDADTRAISAEQIQKLCAPLGLVNDKGQAIIQTLGTVLVEGKRPDILSTTGHRGFLARVLRPLVVLPEHKIITEFFTKRLGYGLENLLNYFGGYSHFFSRRVATEAVTDFIVGPITTNRLDRAFDERLAVISEPGSMGSVLATRNQTRRCMQELKKQRGKPFPERKAECERLRREMQQWTAMIR